MTDTEMLAWTAGFLEGEGSFTLNKNSPRVTAVQVEREPLEWLKEAYGGTIQRAARRPPRRDLLQWNLFGREASRLMQQLRPLLSERRRGQIATVLEDGWVGQPRTSSGQLAFDCAHNLPPA